MSVKNRAVFLDRDGTINYDYGYVHNVKDIRLIRNVYVGLRRLSEEGFLLIVITNQSGVGRGYFSIDDVNNVNEEISLRLQKKGIAIAKFYICPHTPDDCCSCRKPLPHMIIEAAKEFNIDLSQSYMIGDKPSDVKCGMNAGVESFLIEKGKDINFWSEYIVTRYEQDKAL